MKKWSLILVLAILVAAAYIYLFVPGVVGTGNSLAVNSPLSATLRMLSEAENRSKWWPGTVKNDSIYEHEGYSFHIKKRLYQGVQLIVQKGDFTDTCSVIIVPGGGKDSSVVQWVSTVQTGSSPLSRLSRYNAAGRYKKEVQLIQQSFKTFVEDKDKVYGVNVQQKKVTDTLLISTAATFNHVPATAEIYALINKLKTYIAAQGAKQTNHPMLFTQEEANNVFLTRVAIPVDRQLAGNGDIVYKSMIAGNILMTGDIKGGEATVKKIFSSMNDYVADYQKIPPAIPFELLVTDRLQQPDSSAWITRIYYPVF